MNEVKLGFAGTEEPQEKGVLKYLRVGFDNISSGARFSQEHIYEFFLTDTNAEAPIRFLTREVVSFTAHSVKEGKRWVNYVCTKDDNCILCNRGEVARERCIFLILDGSSFKYKKNGSEIAIEDTVKFLIRNAGDGMALKALAKRYGLDTTPYIVTKNPAGQIPQYTFSRETDLLSLEEFKNKKPELWGKATAEEIEPFVREKLPEKYKTMSYLDIIASNLKFYEDTDTTSVSV